MAIRRACGRGARRRRARSRKRCSVGRLAMSLAMPRLGCDRYAMHRCLKRRRRGRTSAAAIGRRSYRRLKSHWRRSGWRTAACGRPFAADPAQRPFRGAQAGTATAACQRVDSGVVVLRLGMHRDLHSADVSAALGPKKTSPKTGGFCRISLQYGISRLIRADLHPAVEPP